MDVGRVPSFVELRALHALVAPRRESHGEGIARLSQLGRLCFSKGVSSRPFSPRFVSRFDRSLVLMGPSRLLHRATGFWKEHEAVAARVRGTDSGEVSLTSELLGNYFLMKRRPGIVREPSWRGGLMRPTNQLGRRASAPYEETGDAVPQESDGGRGVTAWRDGRLERTGNGRIGRAASVGHVDQYQAFVGK